MLNFKIVTHGSEEYKLVVELRDEILRKPLGLTFSAEDLESEKNQIHVAGYRDQQLCATCMLVPEGDVVRMKRVAIKEEFQEQGIGSAMMGFCEDFARKVGFKSIYCSARDTAIPFYEKNGYETEGEPYIEIGIVHQQMRKMLR